jgi:hypothetical protein
VASVSIIFNGQVKSTHEQVRIFIFFSKLEIVGPNQEKKKKKKKKQKYLIFFKNLKICQKNKKKKKKKKKKQH